MNERYEIESYIGNGTFGYVYRGKDLLNFGKVAIKVSKADPKYQVLAEQELDFIRMLSNIPH